MKHRSSEKSDITPSRSCRFTVKSDQKQRPETTLEETTTRSGHHEGAEAATLESPLKIWPKRVPGNDWGSSYNFARWEQP